MQQFSAGKIAIISISTTFNMIFSNVYMLDSELWGRCFPCPTLLRFVMDVCKALKNKLLLHVCHLSSLQEDWLAVQAAQNCHCVAGTGIMRSFCMPASDNPRGCSIQREGHWLNAKHRNCCAKFTSQHFHLNQVSSGPPPSLVKLNRGAAGKFLSKSCMGHFRGSRVRSRYRCKTSSFLRWNRGKSAARSL
jgi:hypothetical protein